MGIPAPMKKANESDDARPLKMLSQMVLLFNG
jgi:hypothetical protein